MFLNQLSENLILINYRSWSNPPNIGDPMIKAIITAAPKIIPTAINRLFIGKIQRIPE